MLLFFQSKAQQTITTAGGQATGINGSVSYTIGQIDFNAVENTYNSISEGVQQVYQINVETALEQNIESLFSIKVYPNPTSNNLQLKINGEFPSEMDYHLYDSNGKLVEPGQIHDNITVIQTQSLPPSTYFLHVLEEDKVVKTFKIIKK